MNQLHRLGLMESRPQSRFQSRWNSVEDLNDRNKEIFDKLKEWNPRAFTKNPPKNANQQFLSNLRQIIVALKGEEPKADTVTRMLQLMHLQQRVLEATYNHLYFIYKQGWLHN